MVWGRKCSEPGGGIREEAGARRKERTSTGEQRTTAGSKPSWKKGLTGLMRSSWVANMESYKPKQ